MQPLITCSGPLVTRYGQPGSMDISSRGASIEARISCEYHLNSFSQMGSHRSEPIGKLCRSAFSLILARSFWTGRDVSSA